MQQTIGHRSELGPAGLGIVLVGIGAIALVVRQLGIDLFEAVGASGWPLFVIVPGLVLLFAAFVPVPPRGLGFAISGTIVTTIGGLLLYQNETGHWESWAYAWALLPTMAGVAVLAYGTLTRTQGMVSTGLWLAAIGGAMFAAGAWFFEGIFAGEARPLALAESWPFIVIAVGALITVMALFGQRKATPPPSAPTASPPTPGA